MELKFKKIMAIVVLSVLAFPCFAEDESEPNKQLIEKKVNSSAERSEVELTTELVSEGDNSNEQIETKLAKEYYKDCVQNLKWALGIIVVLVAGFIGYAIFKSRREYRETLADVKEALRETRGACKEAREASDKARDYEEKAHERLRGIDKEVACKLKEIEEKGEELVRDLIKEAEEQRKFSRNEAEKERKASEFWSMGVRSVDAQDFESAANYFASIIEFKPEDHTAYVNWGAALTDLAKLKEGAESDELFRQAFEKYQKSVEIKPDENESYYNWGTALTDLAKLKEGAESDELFRQAFEKYEKAVQIKTDHYKAYNNWGTALSDLAERKEGAESYELFRQAFEKYEKVVQIKTDHYNSYKNWGTALSDLAKKREDEDRSRLFEEAKQKYLKAESIKKGVGAYNLACVCALLDDERECERWIKIGEEAGTLPTRSHVLSDPDLESVRDKEWFKEIRWSDKAK